MIYLTDKQFSHLLHSSLDEIVKKSQATDPNIDSRPISA
jgi:hypothetical protein